MKKSLFVTGTGTDVGKTYITGLLVRKMKEYNMSVAYFKAAMSGNEKDENGNLIPGDAAFVKSISRIDESLEDMCPYVYEQAFSPHLASRLEGNPVKMSVVKKQYERICNSYEYVWMEGSGGIVCPISYDEERIQLEDIIKELQLVSVLVADAGLGTINSVVLTADYMKSRGLPVKGIIFNHYHKGNVMEEDNIKMCKELTGLPVIACVQDGDIDIALEKEDFYKLFEVKENDLVSISTNENNETAV